MATNEQLAEAEKAYHQLMTGTAPRVIVDQNGERVEFTPANSSRLAAYIQQLKKELGLLEGVPKGPMGFYF